MNQEQTIAHGGEPVGAGGHDREERGVCLLRVESGSAAVGAPLARLLRVEDLVAGQFVILYKPGCRSYPLKVLEVGERYVFFEHGGETGLLVDLYHRTGLRLEQVCDESWMPFEMYEYRGSIDEKH